MEFEPSERMAVRSVANSGNKSEPGAPEGQENPNM
jgi:hypothetical protein